MQLDQEQFEIAAMEANCQNSKKVYTAPYLKAYGSVSDCTLAVGRPGHVKGGGVCFHIDKHGEMSGIPCS